MQPSPERYKEFDLLRTLAALGIILFHLGIIIFTPQLVFSPYSLSAFLTKTLSFPLGPVFLITQLGDHAVPLFLILSSYCLTRQKKTGFTWLYARLKKIILPYWFAIFACLPLLLLAWQINPDFLSGLNLKPVSPQDFLVSAFLLQNFLPHFFQNLIPAWWFLPILVQLYFIYPLLQKLREKTSLRFLFFSTLVFELLFSLVLIFLKAAGNPFFLPLRYSALSYVFLYSLGIFLAGSGKLPSFKSGFIIWLTGFLLRFPLQKSILISEAFIAVGTLAMGFHFSHFLLAKKPVFATTLSTVGRRFSYQIFLWHQPLIFFLGSLLTKP